MLLHCILRPVERRSDGAQAPVQVGKRKLEHLQRGLHLFSVLLELKELDPEHSELLRELLAPSGPKTCCGFWTTSRQKQPSRQKQQAGSHAIEARPECSIRRTLSRGEGLEKTGST